MDNILPEYEVKELPSRFIAYPEGTVIKVKPYTFGAAMNIEFIGKNNIRTLSEILEGVKVEGLPKNLLTPQDILFLGLYRNLVSSKHNKIDVKSYCPKCLKENHTTKTLDAIKFKDIENFTKDVYPIEVDFDNYTMWFSFVTYKDFDFCMKKYRGSKLHQIALQVVKFTNKETKEIEEKPDYNANTDRTGATTKIEMYVEKVRKILYNFVDEDKDTLDEVLTYLEDYGLKPVEVKCEDENCEYEYTVNFDDENVLVTPFRDPKKLTRDRIKLRSSNLNKSDTSKTDEPDGSRTTVGTNNEESIRKEKPTVRVAKTQESQIEYFKN